LGWRRERKERNREKEEEIYRRLKRWMMIDEVCQ